MEQVKGPISPGPGFPGDPVEPLVVPYLSIFLSIVSGLKSCSFGQVIVPNSILALRK